MKNVHVPSLVFLLLIVAGAVGLKVYAYELIPTEAVTACIESTKQDLNRPLSFDRKFGTTEVTGSSSLKKVKFEYTAKNGFGNDVPGAVECHYLNGSVMSLNHFD